MPESAVFESIAIVQTTVGTPEGARLLARLALEHRLAACIQAEQVTSHYRWRGALHEEAEWRLTCKTTLAVAPALAALLRERHPYALPEIVVATVQASAGYARWVGEEVAPPPAD
ncbi:MAG: divalent-cation tolerance protein CutA [Comamonadaceae bacterium]|nr:divalent-cation tolerance protein CutA [Burkholderiales bacterium]MEB2348720.1 divalent-cation tolerance protein CutA [Comamonadaceae bacterium]